MTTFQPLTNESIREAVKPWKTAEPELDPDYKKNMDT